MSEDAVIGFLFKSEEEDSIEKLMAELEDSEFEKNPDYQEPVYDRNGARVFVYPRSDFVYILQRTDDRYMVDHYYNIEEDFERVSSSLKAPGKDMESKGI